jgi:hypothetical protein
MGFHRLILLWVVSLMLIVQPCSIEAQSDEPFVIESVNTHLKGDVFFLNAVFNIHLPFYITDAIEQGFNLPIVIEIEFYRDKRFWFDEQVVYIKQKYQLNYHPLLDAVSVFDVNSGRRQYYSSLKEAMRHLSVMLNYPVLDKNTLSEDQSYSGRLRIGVDQSELPVPLKSSSLWKNNWDLNSDWLDWTVIP